VTGENHRNSRHNNLDRVLNSGTYEFEERIGYYELYLNFRRFLFVTVDRYVGLLQDPVQKKKKKEEEEEEEEEEKESSCFFGSFCLFAALSLAKQPFF
jgi:hypothetical protein